VTSLVEGGRQELIRMEEFQGKIAAAVATRRSRDFLIPRNAQGLVSYPMIRQ